MDNIAFDASSSVRTKDSNGFLRVAISPISKECVNPYYGREIPGWENLHLDPERIYYGYRPGPELDKAAASFNGLPILFDHHPESAEHPQKEFRVGSVGTDVRFNSPYLESSLIFTDEDAIKAVEDGSFREISSAYRYFPLFKTGEFNGVPYDFEMRNIEGNHVAIVEEGRAGHDVVVADSNTVETTENQENGDDVQVEKLGELIAELKTLLGKYGFSKHEGVDEEAKEMVNEVSTDEGIGKNVDENPPVVTDNEAGDAAAELFSLIDTINDEELAAKVKSVAEKLTGEKPIAEDEAKNADPNKLGGEVTATEKKEPPAMDANTIKKTIEASMKAKHDAARACAPLIGSIVDPFAYDSANAIYGEALRISGVDPNGYEPSAWRGMVDMLRKSSAPSVQTFATDSKMSKDDEKVFAGLKNIRVEG